MRLLDFPAAGDWRDHRSLDASPAQRLHDPVAIQYTNAPVENGLGGLVIGIRGSAVDDRRDCHASVHQV